MKTEMSPAEKFSILGVETRVKIIELLKKQGALGAKYIAQEFSITPAAVSQHLKILKQAGLVSCERKGYHIPYSLNEAALEDCREVLSKVCSCKGTANISLLTDDDLNQATTKCLQEYEKKLEENLNKVRHQLKKTKQVKDDRSN